MSVDKSNDHITKNEKYTGELNLENFNGVIKEYIKVKDEYENLLKKEGGNLSKEINLEYKNKLFTFEEVIKKAYWYLNIRKNRFIFYKYIIIIIIIINIL